MAANYLQSTYKESSYGDLRTSTQDPQWAFGARTNIYGTLGPNDASGLYSNTWQDSIAVDSRIFSGAGDPNHPRGFEAGKTYKIDFVFYNFEHVDLKIEADTRVLNDYNFDNYGKYTLSYTLTAGQNSFYNFCLNGWSRNRDGSLGSVKYEVHISEAIEPDLVETITAVPKTTVKAGTSLVVNHTLKNIGKGNAPSQKFGIYLSTDSKITSGDVFLGEFTTSALKAASAQNWSSTTLPVPANLKPGTYYVGVIADYNNQVAESKESNNVSNAVKVTIKAPDKLFTTLADKVDFTKLSAKQKALIDASPDGIYNALPGNDTVKLPNTSTLTAKVGWNAGVLFKGAAGDDRIVGGSLSDHIDGGVGSDIVFAGGGAENYLYGGTGEYRDFLYGYAETGPGTKDGKNVIFGGGGNDFLYGGSKNDLLVGGTGTDALYGGNGDDRLISFDPTRGFSADDDNPGEHMNGGLGADTFVAGNRAIVDDMGTQDTLYLRKSSDYTAPLIVKDAKGWEIIQLQGTTSTEKPFDVAFRFLSVATIAKTANGLVPAISGETSFSALGWSIEDEIGVLVNGAGGPPIATKDSALLSVGFYQPTDTASVPTVEAQLRSAASLTKYRHALEEIEDKLAGLGGDYLKDKIKNLQKSLGKDIQDAATKVSPADLISGGGAKASDFDNKAFAGSLSKILVKAVSSGYSADDFLKDVSTATLGWVKSGWIATSLDVASPLIDAVIKDVFGLLTVHVDSKTDRILQGIGSPGDDTVRGGAGADILIGGAGDDTFVFKNKPGKSNIDHIVDFRSADDTVMIENAVFKGLKAGALASSQFKDITYSVKLDHNDHILYNHKTGQMYFDPDGSGKAPKVQFAIFDDHPSVTYHDLLVY